MVNKLESNYFFCFSKKTMEYLRYTKGIKFVTAARQLHSDNVFYLFERTPELDQALSELN